MNFGDILLLRKLGLGVLTLTGAMTSLLGGWILISAYASPPEIASDTAKIQSQLQSREPSSIMVNEVYSVELDKSDSKVETVLLRCLKDGLALELKSMAKQIRLKSQLCGGRVAALDVSSIVNRTNGFVATLYNLDSGEFTSDYISLEQGANHLMFEINDKNGFRSAAEISIIRDL